MLNIVLLISLLAGAFTATPRHRGIINQKAPTWGVTEWYQLPQGKKSLDVTDFKGKVIYLFCFQSWCPGCHKYGFPTLKQVIGAFRDDPDVAIVTVQTTFEGYDYNSFSKARKTIEKYELKTPVGQSGTRGRPSILMRNYRTGGTPWIVIIDKKGVVRYNDFHIYPQMAIQLIQKLKKVPADS
ncbi:MAG: redoxin domain-containing protein [bacterium]